MDERDQAALGTDAWGFIDKTHSLGLELCERCLDIVDLDRNMVNAAASLLQELTYGRVVGCRFEQFDTALADAEHGDTNFLVLNDLCMDVFEAESVFPKLESLVDALRRDA